MTKRIAGAARWLQLAGVVGVAVAALAISGCASVYVDTTLGDTKPEDIKKPAQPKPVQYLFSFQTKGTANASATNLLKTQVVEQVQASGLFSQVSEAPVEGGSLLNITINNVPLTDDAAAKGFATGLTFGLAGSTVTDGYIGTLEYLPPAPGAKISLTAQHAIHTTVGATNPPPHAEKADGFEAAARKVVRQLVAKGLKDLAQDPGFAGK